MVIFTIFAADMSSLCFIRQDQLPVFPVTQPDSTPAVAAVPQTVVMPAAGLSTRRRQKPSKLLSVEFDADDCPVRIGFVTGMEAVRKSPMAIDFPVEYFIRFHTHNRPR